MVPVQFSTYIDRSNLAFAAFQFKADLHISNSVYGLGASIFFVGYTVSQVCVQPVVSELGLLRYSQSGAMLQSCWNLAALPQTSATHLGSQACIRRIQASGIWRIQGSLS